MKNRLKIDLSVEEILEQYKPLVMSIARRYYLVGAELDDLIQEGMIGLYKAINSYESDKNASFSTFANLCITRQIQSAIKNGNRLKNSFFKEIMNEDDVALQLLLSPQPNPEDKVILEEEYFLIKKEINEKLSQLEKNILNIYLTGKSYEEIAFKLGVTKKSVDNALNRIRNKLAYLLKK